VLSRVLSAAIIFFWITMTVLLLRSEIWPGQSKIRSVPIEHVAKLFWLHQQPSDLTIWSENTRVGNLHLHPKIRKEDGARILEYSGNLQWRLPGSQRQRVSWSGIAIFDDELALSSLHVVVPVGESPLMRAEVLVTPSENLARYQLFNGETEIEHEDYALDESGLKKVLKQLDLDPALYESVRGSATVPVVSARQSNLSIRQGRIDTFLLSMKQGGQTLIEAHVNQLGVVAKVTTLVGYSLAPEEFLP
jgi:hypothetical protein